jgi:lipopolysaccharide/colanic/teichoic acid biosynthesis glycosyltransferase
VLHSARDHPINLFKPEGCKGRSSSQEACWLGLSIMALQGDKSVSRVAQATVQAGAVAVIGLDEWTKRIVDIVIATMGLVLFAPLLLLTAMAISLESQGPIFVREALPGCNNRAIRFRVTCPADKRINPRLTRVGQILSLTGVDELPQLINVLLGEMSIIGRRNVGRWLKSVCTLLAGKPAGGRRHQD